jgi:hypothetical protein
VTPFMQAVNALGPVIANGAAMLATTKEAARAGQWAEAAARIEAWAERLAVAVEGVKVAELPPLDDETAASIVRTLGCAGRMYAMAVDAANHAWARAARAGGARA